MTNGWFLMERVREALIGSLHHSSNIWGLQRAVNYIARTTITNRKTRRNNTVAMGKSLMCTTVHRALRPHIFLDILDEKKQNKKHTKITSIHTENMFSSVLHTCFNRSIFCVRYSTHGIQGLKKNLKKEK